MAGPSRRMKVVVERFASLDSLGSRMVVGARLCYVVADGSIACSASRGISYPTTCRVVVAFERWSQACQEA